MEVVRVDPGLLRRTVEEELRVMDHVLVERGGGGDEDRDGRLVAPAGPAELLPRRGDRARVAGQDRRVEPADVDAELERVRRDDAEDLAVAQAALDRPPLRRQIAAAIAADARPRPEPLAERLAQPGQQDLDGRPRAARRRSSGGRPAGTAGPSGSRACGRSRGRRSTRR